MKDIYDGDVWNDLHTEIKQEKEDRPGGNIRDVGKDGREGEKLNDNRFALHMTVNLDWYASSPMLLCLAMLTITCIT
jgi:hypothetical protein